MNTNDTIILFSLIHLILMLLAIWYGVLALLVPIFIYRTMRRATQILQALKSYEKTSQNNTNAYGQTNLSTSN